ncbi:zinc finger protein 40 [Neoarius graeffei]|uniref:zinc finger protein 40 n=1 Tax=Neoarius graeffei TaxID=443677 RepID=UPI00298BDE47|nr:zinc finger protein 40 [Neoarius graeffei]XP_060799194.1 zinc finger protein 40 [Neoarius graeffei]XP_060799195.1 zinc finger protein 40 [Neoarius graeffei]XP_060799196.1 zinc finger protein 40 [Neoarius graeffei]
MPRTKQNNPKNLKDKIEEAQKELKEPRGGQKGRNESTGRSSDSIKGLKRKKVVAENQLKKIPKSPIKKLPQTKKSVSPTDSALSKEATPARLFSKSPAHSTSKSVQDSEDDKQETLADKAVKVENKDLTTLQSEALVHQKGADKTCVVQSMLAKSWSDKVSNKGTSASHTAAPLEVLLKAMEPDFSTLTEKKNCNPIGQLGKATSLPVPQSDAAIAMPSVNFGPQSHQPAVMQSYTTAKLPFCNSALTGVRSAEHHSSQQHLNKALDCQHDKPGLQKSYSAGPSFNLTYAPVPSGSSGLPQSQPPIVQTCQSLSATVPNPIQVPVTPGFNPVQVATVVNFGMNQMCDVSTKEQKTKKQGKYVCEYCNRACAKPSVLLKHIRSHTGERPYPCVTCGFSFKTKSNLYKHKKSHAHAIKLGLISKDSGSGSLSQESDKGLGTNSDVEESGESDEEVNTADLDPDSSLSILTALSESSLHSSGIVPGSQGNADHSVMYENIKPLSSQKGCEPKVPAALPKVVVYPVNVSPLRADSPRVTDSNPDQATAQRQRDFQTASLRSSITVLSSLKEVDCTSPLPDFISEDDSQQYKSPSGSGHAQLQRQQATDHSQQPQGKCLLSPRSLGSTDSGYFSRSESADQAVSPPSPFVKITPPTESDLKNPQVLSSPIVATVMHVATSEKPPVLPGQMRPPLETKALSLEERITKLISDNEAVVDDKQLDSVKPRRTSLSRRGSIDSPKSYIFKDSFQFDLKPVVRRSNSNSDIPKSPFTPTDKSKPIFLLSVPPQYPTMDCLPITRSNSVPTTPGHSAVLPNATPQPHRLRICQSFDDKFSSLNDEVFSPAPSTPNQAVHRTLVRQIAVEDFSTNEGHVLLSVHSMDESHYGSSITHETRSKSFDHAPERTRKSQPSKGTTYECETCRNRYRKLENFENHKKFYCSELHGPKNKTMPVRDVEPDVFARGTQQPVLSRNAIIPSIVDQPMIRKRRKMKSVGDDEDQSPTETPPPSSKSFDSCQLSMGFSGNSYTQHTPTSNPPVGQIQLIARGTEEARLSPIREIHISTCSKERAEPQRQGSGTSVIRHTNSLSRPNSFEMSESIDRSSPVDSVEKDANNSVKRHVESTISSSLQSYHEKMSTPKCPNQGINEVEKQTSSVTSDSCPSTQSRLVRQNNIQVPEILVTEEPDREHESQLTESTEKPSETFNWPQRSESLSKLPTEKLPPKKKRIRLAQMEHSSGESSFESSLSRSLSRDSSLSRCSSISASFDRDDPPRSDSPSRVEGVRKPPEVQGLPVVSNTLGVPGMMRRAASEQISCTQQSVEISCDYRSKSFDCSTISPSRSTSPMVTTLPKNTQSTPTPQVPLIERRRGPLVRQMSLKIGPETQQPKGKPTVSLQRGPSANIFSVSQHRSLNVNKPVLLHSGESPLKKNVKIVQSINLGSQTQQPQIHGLPHPWHQTSKLDKCQESLVHVVLDEADIEKPVDADHIKNFVPKYQLQYPVLKTGKAHSFTSVQGAQITLPVITIPIANEIKVSTFSDGIQNVSETQPSQQSVSNRGVSVVLPIDPEVGPASQSFSEPTTVPQILITNEHTLPTSTVDSKVNLTEVNTNAKIGSDRQNGRSPGSVGFQMKTVIPAIRQNHIGEIQSTSSPGSLHCTQKLVSVSLCPQQEPTASSKRMLSPANSLDIAMEKTQKRAKDDHSAACLTDGRSLSYLNSKMSELTRQRKLMLVRQVCTTEPVDSPIETDAPEQLPECREPEKDNQIEICHTKCDVVEQEMESRTPTTTMQTVPGSDTHSSPGMQSHFVPGNTTLKSQEKPEENHWFPAKPHLRPQTYPGQIKLAASVSVVNTRDSHRLSFPSLKTATTFTWCFLLKRKPLHIEQTDQRISAYSTWTVKSKNPNPLGLPTKVVMSLFDSKQISKKILYTQAITTSLKSDILTYSGKLKDVLPKVLAQRSTLLNENCGKAKPESQSSHELDSSKAEPRRVKIFDGGYKSNEEYVYVRGRGRGKYICEECGIRCKKPSMLRKHIRTHSDVRPYHCAQCNFSFKTKGNLTKHMKSKAHSKKCMEMGVAIGVIEDHDTEDSGGDHGRMGNADRQDSDGDDSDGPDDEDNDGEEEDEEDSQAESGLSATPSVSASPQHLPSSQADPAPSSLLAQMSISPNPNPAPLPQIPGSKSQALDTDSLAITSSVSLVRQMSSSAVCSSHGPSPSYFVSYPAPTSECNSSDTESVHMMSPVSPCRQMSIDYPDPDVPPSPPMPSKISSSGQDESTSSDSQTTNESNSNVDRSTQTTSDSLQGSLHFPPLSPDQDSGAGATTRLFSHLPLHSQQPNRSPHSMVPVGGIQLVPAGLAAYSTFVPIQAGPVQLTIPAVSVIHRQASSPLPMSNTSPQPQGSPCQPLVVQEPISSVLPCFPLGQVAGLQTLSAPQATLQPVGMETLSVVGLANSTQLVPQQSLALNAALGVQVLAASPAPQSSTASPGHIPGLQILNIALPALIPSLSPLSALSPLVPDKPGSPDGVASVSLPTQVAESPPASSPSGSFPAAWPAATPVAIVPVAVKPLVEMASESKPTRSGKDIVLSTIDAEKAKLTLQAHTTSSTEGESESAQKPPSVEAGEARLPRQPITRQPVTDDFNNASSDDEDRLVIAT